MKIFLSLCRIIEKTILYGIVGTILCAAAGLGVGIIVSVVIGLPLTLLANNATDGVLAGGVILGLCAGAIGGFVAFPLAGLVAGVQSEFRDSSRLRFDTCVEGAMLASLWCCVGGLLTGAMVGILLITFPQNRWGQLERVLFDAGLGGALGYTIGLILGALAPGLVQTVQLRWRDWRRQRRNRNRPMA